jgi:SlyX protein
LNETLKRVEEKIAYLERHVTEQDKAMLELAAEIADLRKQLKALRGRSSGGSHERDLGGDVPDERPPHY